MTETTYVNTPNRTGDVGGTTFAYRELGTASGVPVIFLNRLAAVLDNWDPRVVDGIDAKHRVIVFDNRWIGASAGSTPDTIEAMARDAVAFIRALGFEQVDLLGFSLGGDWEAVRCELDGLEFFTRDPLFRALRCASAR
jgi:pimeloyl-ACP methyl ester carboxylesterase